MSKSQIVYKESLVEPSVVSISNTLPRHKPADDHFDINEFRLYLERSSV